jgi:hypothetical protein
MQGLDFSQPPLPVGREKKFIHLLLRAAELLATTIQDQRKLMLFMGLLVAALICAA